jgi:hypothetical protein
MERRKFTREFKLEAATDQRAGGCRMRKPRTISGASVTVAGLGEGACGRSAACFPGQGQMKPEQLEIAQLKREVVRLRAERDILSYGPRIATWI